MHPKHGRGSFSTNIPSSVRCGMESISLWHCWGTSEPLAHLDCWIDCFSSFSWKYAYAKMGFTHLGFCASPVFLHTPDLDFQIKFDKRTLYHWATVQLFFSVSQVRCLWCCFGFKSGLVALFLKTSERCDSWCTDSSFRQLLWSSPKCLNLLCLTVFSSLRSSLLLVNLFLLNFFLPVNFAFNMLWYSTLWKATPFSNDLLWLNLFVEGVNVSFLGHCQVRSLPHFKEQEIPQIYTEQNYKRNIFVFAPIFHELSSKS